MIFMVNISNLSILNHIDLNLGFKEKEINHLRQLDISYITSSIPFDKIYRRILKFLIKFIQMVYICFDVICTICSQKLINGTNICPECKRISPSKKKSPFIMKKIILICILCRYLFSQYALLKIIHQKFI